LLRGDDAQAEPYVSKTANLRRRLQRLLGPVEERTKKLNLRESVRWIEYVPTGSDFESGVVLYKVLRSTFPKTYANRLRFRFAPLVKLNLENQYPRASITTRLGRLNGRNLYYGPFPSRTAAEKFMNDSLDFFKMRRCVDDLHPDPSFPGCIYSEMKMCLAPCFKGCTDEEYYAEVNRVQAYFDSGGDSLAREFSAQRDAASANLAFEDASAIHVRLEKLKPTVNQLSEIVRPRSPFRADHSTLPARGIGNVFPCRPRSAIRTGRILHPTRRAHKVSIDGIACAAGARFAAAREIRIRAGNHGTSCVAQALVLPRPPHGRNISCGRSRRPPHAPHCARHWPGVTRRRT